jgi:hypothetical protein
VSRLPIPGKDAHVWGAILNDFLQKGHHADGSHKLDTDDSLAANSDQAIASQKAVKAYIDGQVSTQIVGDATTTIKGKLRLQGDLTGNADTPLVKSRTGVTVGLVASDYTYDAGMSPGHYADAVNSALGTGNANVFLRGETVAFGHAAGKVVTPVSGARIDGAGIDKTVIQTSRPDYVFKNTAAALLNAVVSNLTIDCQSLATVSGVDIRKFTQFVLRHVKFLGSVQWFARFGNEPSGSTTEISSGLVIEDCEFASHQGIYEMLLLYNLGTADVNRCIFRDKTGTPGAAPTIGIWQKAADITIRNSLFSNLASSAIYYAYSTHRIRIENCSFLNVGQAVRGANVSDNGKFGEKTVQGLGIDSCWMIGGANSTATDAIQVGSVDGFSITNTCIKDYAKGIRIGFGNSTPTAGGDGGDAYYPSRRGVIANVSFININNAGNAVSLNSPLYFANGGDFGQLVIRDCIVYDPNDYLDYAVIFNGGSTATASVLAGSVTGVTVTNTFAWYATPPTVTISGNGSGATATATIDSDGHLTAVQVTNGGTGYTTASVTITGGSYKNITFVDCDFGGKQIRVNDNAQIDWQTVQFINCRNFDTSNLAAATIDQAVKNNARLVSHDGKLGIGVTTLAASTDLQIGDGSTVVTMRLNNVQEKNSNDNIQKIFANFSGKTETLYKNNTNSTSRRSVLDIDTGVYSANGFDTNLGTDLTTGGLVAKRLTTAQRDALGSPGNGTIIYNTSTNKLQAYENGTWANLI